MRSGTSSSHCQVSTLHGTPSPLRLLSFTPPEDANTAQSSHRRTYSHLSLSPFTSSSFSSPISSFINLHPPSSPFVLPNPQIANPHPVSSSPPLLLHPQTPPPGSTALPLTSRLDSSRPSSPNRPFSPPFRHQPLPGLSL